MKEGGEIAKLIYTISPKFILNLLLTNACNPDKYMSSYHFDYYCIVEFAPFPGISIFTVTQS